MARKINLKRQEAAELVADLLEHMEDYETIEVERNDNRFIVTAPDEVMNSYEDNK